MVTSVLAGLAGTRYGDAVVQTAVDVAGRHGVPVTAITALNVRLLRNVGPVPLGGGQAAKELRDHRVQVTEEAIDKAVSQFEARCNASGVSFRVKREDRESPYDFLASQSRYHDVTVLSLQDMFDYDIRGANDADAGVTLAKLISGGVRPILAVPIEFRPVKRVFAAYSGSMESAATLRRFLQLRPYRDFELCIVTFEMAEERGRRLLASAAEYCRGHGIDAETEYIPMTARHNLLPEARRRGADLVVLGNSAKSLLVRRVFGETALQAIRESELPLFLSQ